MPGALIENLPYPDLSGLVCDYQNARILMPAYADSESELTAVLQYIFHSFNFGARGMTEYADMMDSIAIAEMRHIELLGDALIRLGVSPIFARRPPTKCDFYSACHVDYSTLPAAMLSADITAETRAIRAYEQMLDQFTDSTLNALVNRILLDERLHLERLKAAYRTLVDSKPQP